jgi:hypothetical protein
MAPEQDWCLECGDEVSTKIAKPPGWRVPLAIVLGTLALAGLATFLILNALDDDANKAAAGGRAAAARPTTTPHPRTSAARRSATAKRPARRQATGVSPTPVPRVPFWPTGRTGYTIVVAAPNSRPAAEVRARTLIHFKRDAGILRSDDYDFFGPGLWVVWRGKYTDRAMATKKLAEVKKAFPSAYVTFIRRKS